MKLHDALATLEEAAEEHTDAKRNASAPRWLRNEKRQALVRASIRHANAVQRARRERR